MKRRKTIIFDLDGTLFRTETVDIVAINKALAANGYEQRSEEEILDCIGLTMDEMCARFGIRGTDRVSKLESFLMVGDRDSDINAGRESGGITIGMLHGFGGNEPFKADFTAGSIAELKKVIKAICERESDFVKEN